MWKIIGIIYLILLSLILIFNYRAHKDDDTLDD